MTGILVVDRHRGSDLYAPKNSPGLRSCAKSGRRDVEALPNEPRHDQVPRMRDILPPVHIFADDQIPVIAAGAEGFVDPLAWIGTTQKGKRLTR